MANKPIEHNITGVQDFILDKLEEVDGDTELKPELKLKAVGMYLQQLRGFVSADLQYRALLIKAPAIVKDRSITVPLGKTRLLEAKAEEPEKKSAAG